MLSSKACLLAVLVVLAAPLRVQGTALYDYLVALAANETYYYTPVDPQYYATAAFADALIVSFNGTYYEDFNGTFYELYKDANGTFQLVPDVPGLTEALSPDGYDYGEILGLSLLFYEAQRSGPLPSTNRIPWRGDSALGDVTPGGTPLAGGWYDAGDTLKLNFPAAWTASVLAWGYLEFQDGYASAAQTTYIQDTLRWIADYFVLCHYADLTFTAQVGNVDIDHSQWTRPEELVGARPSFDLTPSAPGSDLLGETVAALASIAIVFQGSDPTYSASLESHARDLYAFATAYEGKYSDSIQQAYVYPSTNYLDDLAWGATWLYQLTNESQFLTDAINYNQRNINEEGGGGYLGFCWDNAYWGTQVKLASLIGNQNPAYAQEAARFIEGWIAGTADITYTPDGLAWSSQWGSLRYTTNAAFIAEVFSAHIAATDDLDSKRYECWARSQIKYVLGDGTGSSFVTGSGNNPPTHSHHRGSSCPVNGTCGFDIFNDPSPNPNTLFGALVGGPGNDDSYVDVRTDYVKNEVAVDYNSGFTGALAALAANPFTWNQCVAGQYIIPRGTNIG